MGTQLLLLDNGRVLRDNNEEITTWRWARKSFPLSSPATSATLWALVYEYEENRSPLIVEVNGISHRIEPSPSPEPAMLWRSLALRPDCLRGKELTCVLKVPDHSGPSWALAVAGQSPGHSALSVDQGRSWQADRLGIYGYGPGEYVVRMVCESQAPVKEPAPPAFASEDPRHPRLEELRQFLDQLGAPLAGCDEWTSQQQLCTWVAGLWPYANSSQAVAYAPWDPWFMIDWTRRKNGQGRPGGVISMCVHYGVFYTLAALARGWPARCIIVTNDVSGMFGHFLSEVWSTRWNKWVLMDPNGDLHFEKDGHPLGALEVHDSLFAEPATVVPGPGHERLAPRIRKAIDDMIPQKSYRNVGLWPRNDFLSRPDLLPVHHGSTSYLEPEIIWWQDEHINMPAIFPCFVTDRMVFDARPERD